MSEGDDRAVFGKEMSNSVLVEQTEGTMRDQVFVDVEGVAAAASSWEGIGNEAEVVKP